jgi:hypothetical protein
MRHSSPLLRRGLETVLIHRLADLNDAARLEQLGPLRRQLFGEQAIVLAFDDRITFASAIL